MTRPISVPFVITPSLVRLARDDFGLSERVLGRALGYSKSYISNIEHERLPVTPEFARRFRAVVPVLQEVSMDGPSRTSRLAYRQHVIDGKAYSQRERILDAIRLLGPISRAELAVLFSQVGLTRGDRTWWGPGPQIPLSSVCGRVNILLGNQDKGWPAYIRVHHSSPGPYDHEIDFLVAIDPAPVERDFADFLVALGAPDRPFRPTLSVPEAASVAAVEIPSVQGAFAGMEPLSPWARGDRP